MIKDNIRFDLLRCMCVNSYSLCGYDQKLHYLEVQGNVIRNYRGKKGRYIWIRGQNNLYEKNESI